MADKQVDIERDRQMADKQVDIERDGQQQRDTCTDGQIGR